MNRFAVSIGGLLVRLFAVALLAGLPSGADAARFQFSSVPFPRGLLTAESRVHPVNLVGGPEKELVVSSPESFQILSLTEKGYVPRQTVPVPSTAGMPAGKIYYGFARLQKGNVYTLLLLTPEGVYCFPSDGDQLASEPRQLVKTPLIRGQLGGRPVQYFDFALDLDGDGLDDLLLPEEKSFSILRQTAPLRFSPVALPRNPYKQEQHFSLQQDVPGDQVRAVTYTGSVRRLGGVNDLLIADANSDGLQDLIYTSFGPGPDSTEVIRYEIHPQRRGFTFASEPSQVIVLPYDPRADITLRDLNRDGRLDAVSVRSNFDIANPRTVTRLFLADQKREQFFSSDTFRFVTKDPIGLISIGDFNGDSIPDFATTYFSYQFSSADDIVDLVLASKVRFKLQFFLGRGRNGYLREPDAEKELVLQMKAEAFHGAPPFLMADDLNGDRAADLLVRTAADELAVYPSDGPLKFPKNPAQTIRIPQDASVDLEDLDGDGLQDLLVSSPSGNTLTIHLSRSR